MSDTRVRISTLWVFVLFNMIFADIVGFMNPGVLESIISGSTGFEVTQELLLVFAVLLEIPIAMVVLSRTLKYPMARWANIGAALLTILFIIGAGSAVLSYYFFAAMETIGMLLIMWHAWKWREAGA